MFVHINGFVDYEGNEYILNPDEEFNIYKRCFGACTYKNRIYYFRAQYIYSIPITFLQDEHKYKIYKEDQREELYIPYTSIGAHQIMILNNVFIIQETFFNQIAMYKMNEDGTIDASSRYVPFIYPFATNAHIKLNPDRFIHDENLKARILNESNVSDYRHVNSFCIHPRFPNTLITTCIFVRNMIVDDKFPGNNSSESTIDFINMTDWTYQSCTVPAHGIHDLTYHPKDDMLYFTESAHIYQFNPYTKESSIVFTYSPVTLTHKPAISRGFHFDDKGHAWYTVIGVIPSAMNPDGNTSSDTVLVCVDINSWTLISETVILTNKKNFVLSAIKSAITMPSFTLTASNLPQSLPAPLIAD